MDIESWRTLFMFMTGIKTILDIVKLISPYLEKILRKRLSNTPIDALHLSWDVQIALKKSGITTVGGVLDLLERGEAAVKSIRDYGEIALGDLRIKMEEKGYFNED